MTYKEARVYLDEVSKYGSVLGLDTIRNLLREINNPEQDLHFIHIAGTNGKGSVLAYTSTILSEAGYRTGRYVSPTVVSYLERIQVDQQWISEDAFSGYVEQIQDAIARMESKGEASPTVFEIETAIAFLYFRDQKCDYVVLETGLGGKEDATNVVENTLVAAFASISRDHMGFLGDTLEEITRVKAGIIKPGCTVVTAAQRPIVKGVLSDEASRWKCPWRYGELEQVILEEESYQGQRISYGDLVHARLSLAGAWQIQNAVIAYEIVQALRERGVPIPSEAVYRGLEKAKWPGRFQCINEKPLFLVDGAHNEDAVRRLRESLEQYFPERQFIFVIGVFKDKEYEKMAAMMGPLAKQIYTVDLPDRNRTLRAESLAVTLEYYCRSVKAAETIEDAVDQALKKAAKEDVIVAFGSLSYLGRVICYVESKRV